jgi:hypothetical protein
MQITAPTAEPTPVTCLRGRTATRCKAAAADERALRDAALLRDESCGLPGTQLASASSTVWRDPGATSPACRTGLRRLAILANASIANAAPEIAEGAASAFLSSAMLHRNASMRLIASGAPPSFGFCCGGMLTCLALRCVAFALTSFVKRVWIMVGRSSVIHDNQTAYSLTLNSEK